MHKYKTVLFGEMRAHRKIGNKFIQIIYICVYIYILCNVYGCVCARNILPKCHIKHFTVSCNLFYCQLSNRKADIWNFNIQYERRKKRRTEEKEMMHAESSKHWYISHFTHTHTHSHTHALTHTQNMFIDTIDLGIA